MEKYVRLTGIINKKPVAIGLRHDGISLLISNDESLYPIPLSEINNDFYTGDDTAPIYNGFVQYRFTEQDANTIAEAINFDNNLQTKNVKIVNNY